MNKITAAIVREQGQNFTVVMVKQGYANQNGLSDFTQQLPRSFPRPIVLAEQQGNQINYFGRTDISNFLASIDYYQIPWREYSFQ